MVGVYAVHNQPSEPPYLAMEYVPGKTLRDHLKQSEVPLSQIIQWFIEIADGLTAAHASGLIHRDVKPTNILIDEISHKAKLTDFGLARVAETQSDQTKQMLLAGTPAYMSPEQIQHPELVDARSDVFYALEVIRIRFDNAGPDVGRLLDWLYPLFNATLVSSLMVS